MKTIRAILRWLRESFPTGAFVSSAWVRGRHRYHEESEL